MGHYCYTDIVPFIAHGVLYGDPDCDEECSKLFNTEAVLEGEASWQEELSTEEEYKASIPKNISIRGWEYKGTEELGKRNRIWGMRWEKDEAYIWIMNEDEYSHVGEFYMSVVGDDRTHVSQFCEDFKDLLSNRPPINNYDTAQCWA